MCQVVTKDWFEPEIQEFNDMNLGQEILHVHLRHLSSYQPIEISTSFKIEGLVEMSLEKL